MEKPNYLVSPDPQFPFLHYLDCREKGFKLEVVQMFEDPREATYNYEFVHVDEIGRPVSKADYKEFAQARGITREDNVKAARWFITEYLSHVALNYSFPADGNLSVGGYYQVLGNHLERHVFKLNWEG